MSPISPRQPGAGARHAACKVHRDSHNIHKAASSSSPPSSTSTHSSVSSSSNGAAATRPTPAPPRQKQPVIIYTHSPRVIRTSPRDFMSIVQKLTGLDSPGGRGAGCSAATGQDDSSSSSSESCAHAHAGAAPNPYAADPARLMMPPPPLDAHYVAAAATPDMPLFAPGPSELQLCVPAGLIYDDFADIEAAPLLGGQPAMPANMNVGGAVGNDGPMFSQSTMRTFPDY